MVATADIETRARPQSGPASIRVAYLDDHPAVRAGVRALLASTDDLVAVGGASGDAGLWPLLSATEPDVLLLDQHHPGRDGVALCLKVKAAARPPRVVLYTASLDQATIVCAVLAGADAVVGKAGSAPALLGVIREVATGRRSIPTLDLRQQAELAERLSPDDRALYALRLLGVSDADIDATLRLAPGELRRRTREMIDGLSEPDRARTRR